MSLITELKYMQRPYIAQKDFWNGRGLIDQQNMVASPIATLDAMTEEMYELFGELPGGNKKKIAHEATDVGIFGLTGTRWSKDDWVKYGPAVVNMIEQARLIGGLSEEEYSRTAVAKIAVNKDNHHPLGYVALPSHARDSEVLWVYRETRQLMKELRYIHPNAVIPSNLGEVVKLGDRMKDTKYADDPFYAVAFAYLAEIHNIRSYVV